MLPVYILTIDVTSNDSSISEKEFRSLVDVSLAHLDGLKGAFDRSPCTKTYYPPDASSHNYENKFWSARGVVIISVGKKRAEYLLKLYQSISYLIALELPFDVSSEISQMNFS